MALISDFNASGNVSFSRMRMLLQEAGLQEGVYGSADLKVVQRGAGANMSVDVGAGAAWVQVDTGTRNGLAHCYSDAVANVSVGAAHATNPRIDQIVLRFNDTTVPTGSGNVPTLECLAGTATGGATLDNRTGAAALPNDCLRLADVLVPGASSSVVTANIRDRRPWARGAFYAARGTGGGDYTTSSTSAVAIDNTVFNPRIELSGAPVLVTFAYDRIANGSVYHRVQLFVDGALSVDRRNRPVNTNLSGEAGDQINDFLSIAAGSHVFQMQHYAETAINVYIANSSATARPAFTIQEIVRQNTNNS